MIHVAGSRGRDDGDPDSLAGPRDQRHVDGGPVIELCSPTVPPNGLVRPCVGCTGEQVAPANGRFTACIAARPAGYQRARHLFRQCLGFADTVVDAVTDAETDVPVAGDAVAPASAAPGRILHERITPALRAVRPYFSKWCRARARGIDHADKLLIWIASKIVQKQSARCVRFLVDQFDGGAGPRTSDVSVRVFFPNRLELNVYHPPSRCLAVDGLVFRIHLHLPPRSSVSGTKLKIAILPRFPAVASRLETAGG